MKENNAKLVSLSTEPLKTLDALIDYDKELCEFANFIHCDVMDGRFVSRKLLPYKTLKEFSENAVLPLDIHLMTKINCSTLNKFAKLKPKMLTVHYEAFKNKKKLIKTLKKIRQKGILAGVAIKLETKVEELVKILPFVDLVLVMSVKVGYGGQSFDTSAFEKVKQLRNLAVQNQKEILISVDGGVTDKNATQLFENGANILVSGSFVHKSKNRKKAVLSLLK